MKSIISPRPEGEGVVRKTNYEEMRADRLSCVTEECPAHLGSRRRFIEVFFFFFWAKGVRVVTNAEDKEQSGRSTRIILTLRTNKSRTTNMTRSRWKTTRPSEGLKEITTQSQAASIYAYRPKQQH